MGLVTRGGGKGVEQARSGSSQCVNRNLPVHGLTLGGGGGDSLGGGVARSAALRSEKQEEQQRGSYVGRTTPRNAVHSNAEQTYVVQCTAAACGLPYNPAHACYAVRSHAVHKA